jgi:hypothetical protein
MSRAHDRTMVQRSQNPWPWRCLVLAASCCLWTASQFAPLRAEPDALQQAVNYALTGEINPKSPPEITDRKSCVVVLPDPKWRRLIRYHLSRLELDNPRISKTYAGRQARYNLDVDADQIVVEYLQPDKKTVVNGYKSAQIPLPGDIDQTRRALALIASRCKDDDQKSQF